MVYFYILILLSIIGSVQHKYRTNKFISFIIFIGMFLLIGLRDTTIGIDTKAYLSHYANEIYTFEPLYNLLQYFCTKLHFSEHAFLLANACMVILPLSFFIIKSSSNPSLSALIYITFTVYFFVNSMNVLRNAIACSFFLLFLYYFDRNKYKQSILFAIISILFHYSAFIAIVIAILSKSIKRLSPQFIFTSLLISFLLGQLNPFVFGVLNAALNNFNLFGIIQEYSGYIEDVSLNTSNIKGLIMLLLPNIVAVYLIYSKRIENNYFFIIFFIGVLVTNLFIHLQLFYRISIYLVLPIIICWPEAYKKSQLNKIATSIFTAVMVAYFILFIMNSDSAGVFPYKFYFS